MYGNRNYRGREFANTDEEAMEGLNEQLADGLSSKVTQLKSLAFDLDAEARDHLPLLDGLDDEFESSGSRLGGAAGRLRNIGRTRGLTGRRMSLYIALTFTALLIFFYYVIIPRVFNS